MFRQYYSLNQVQLKLNPLCFLIGNSLYCACKKKFNILCYYKKEFINKFKLSNKLDIDVCFRKKETVLEIDGNSICPGTTHRLAGEITGTDKRTIRLL